MKLKQYLSKYNKPLYKNLLFVILFFIIALTYYTIPVLNSGPLSHHIWRQTDCLSLTKNYYEGAKFFEPELHCLLADNYTTGKTAFEFPVLYYTVSQIWKIFGVSYLSFRILYLLIVFTGLFAFYKTLNILLEDSFWSITLTLLLFTSPVYAFYGISFIADAQAFSLILIALYLFVMYAIKQRLFLFYISMLFFALAGLIKVSSLIAFIFLLCIFFLELFPVKTLVKRKLFIRPHIEWTGFVIVLLIVFSWYLYANYYNSIHGFKYTLMNIIPIWDIEKEKIETFIQGLKEHTSYVFFSRVVLYGLLFVGLINLFLFRKIPLFAYLSNILIFIGGLSYFILWGRALNNHDYYFIALLILFPGILLPFILYIKTNYIQIFRGAITKVFVCVLLLFNITYCYSIIKLKTRAQSGNFIFVGSHELVRGLRWVNWDTEYNCMRFATIEPYNRSIGIQKDDKVISISDPSPNGSLFLMNQKGWTGFYCQRKSEQINFFIEKGAKYLFISDLKLLDESFLQPFINDPIGNYKDIIIFRLKH